MKAFAGINKRKPLFVSGVSAASGGPPLRPRIISGEGQIQSSVQFPSETSPLKRSGFPL